MRCELHSARFESRRCDDMADDHDVASTEERQECNNNNNSNNNHNNSNNNHNNNHNHNNNNNSRINVRHDTSRTPKFPDVPEVKIAASVNIQRPQKPKKKRRDKSDLGENFVAPDGGWGWLVAIAGGVNILVSFAVAQQFGIIFRNRMVNIGLSSSELTTIINGQISVSSLTGLLNGPVFRRYTYRQVALVGSALTFLGLFLAVFADSFLFYMCTYSCLYGFGRGLTVSASSLAVNTFFKLKRRTATAYQFGVAGLGPIFLPYIATFLLQFFGVQGTVLIFSGISLHTFACSLVYQPVKWHTAQPPREATSLKSPTPRVQLENEDMGHIVEPETPTLSRANDGWFGSRHSLNALSYRSRLSTLEKEKEKEKENDLQLVDLKRLTINNSFKLRSISISHSIREEQTEIADDPPHDYTKSTELRNKSAAELQQLEREERKKLPLYIKIVIFFDLDLLRDVTYVNLAVGLTLINFVEVNFAILTPFILSDFGFASGQIALAMSILGLCDLVIRFLIPVITASMNFSNKAFFIFGIIGMCVGRAVLSVTRDFYTMLGVFVFMGLNKAFRTVFWSLIIPGHVPLRRLPAAAGLQLLMSGIFSMAFGPLIGLIRDNTNYAFTLNFLNGLCILAIVAWIAEALWRKQQRATPSACAAGP